MLSQRNKPCQKNKSKGHNPAKTRTCPLTWTATLVVRSVSNFLFDRARNAFAENEENEISEEENTQSQEDADDLLVQFHTRPSLINIISVNIKAIRMPFGHGAGFPSFAVPNAKN